MARPFNQFTIIDVVAAWYRVTLKDLVRKDRSRTIVIARHTAMYLIRELTSLSLPEIGALFNRDHTTVVHALNNIERRRKDPEYLADMAELKTLITDQPQPAFRKKHARNS